MLRRGRFNLVPIDFVCKHRRMVNEGPKKWDMQRVMGYHMNGNPKPWNPTVSAGPPPVLTLPRSTQRAPLTQPM